MTRRAGTAGDSARPVAEQLRHRTLSRPWQVLLALASAAAVALVVNQIFNLKFFVGYVLLGPSYLYLLAALLLPLVFVVLPAHAGASRTRVPWYDRLLAAATALVLGFFTWNGDAIVTEGWEYAPPREALVAALVFWAVLVEAGRRAGGTILAVIVAVFSLYPLVADRVPGPIEGFPQPWDAAAAFYALSSEGAFGIPVQALGQLVVGFIIFGAALQATGAGKMFMDLAFALLGHVRGGAAKVSIFSSGLLGSMSGSVITNVLTTGAMSIPAMRRTGVDREHAGAVEACASTGGVLMPPVMGATAFVMASFLAIPYAEVALAAVAPSVLYYFGLFLQIDAYAARRGLKGLPRQELPRLRDAFKEGWHHLFAFALLIWMLLVLKQEAAAPFYATAVLLAVNQLVGKRLGLREAYALLLSIGRTLIELLALLAAVGLIIGALVVTGLAGTLATDLVALAGGNPLLMLAMGAVTSFVLGMGMTVTAAYVFLAIILAPGLVETGLDPLAVHLFILYWGMLSFITPPVALGAFAAASIAGGSPMRTALASMRMGAIIYLIPFFFVLNPALILQGGLGEIALVFGAALVGVALIAAGTQGYLSGFGPLGGGTAGGAARGLLAVAGLLLAYPGGAGLDIGQATVIAVAAGLALLGVALGGLARRRQSGEAGA